MAAIESDSVVAVRLRVCVAVGGGRVVVALHVVVVVRRAGWVVVVMGMVVVVAGVVRQCRRPGNRPVVTVARLRRRRPRLLHVTVDVVVDERWRRKFIFSVTLTCLEQVNLLSIAQSVKSPVLVRSNTSQHERTVKTHGRFCRFKIKGTPAEEKL